MRSFRGEWIEMKTGENGPAAAGGALKPLLRGPGAFGRELVKNRILFLMLLPALAYFVAFCYLPMSGIVLAFKKFDYTGGIFGSPWVGFDNFKFLFQSGVIWNITKNTVYYNVLFYCVGLVFEVTSAIFFSEITGKHFKRVSQSVMFLPYFVSFVLVGVFIYNIFSYEFGALNSILVSLGRDRVDVYSDPGVWKYILAATNVWKWTGYSSVVYLAVIMGFDPALYEAAEIDGANIFRRVWSITLPQLRSTIIILALLFVSRLLKGQFELFYNLIGNNAQLYNATDIIDTYVFRSLVKSFDPGFGTAASLYQSSFGLALLLAINKIVKRLDPESALF